MIQEVSAFLRKLIFKSFLFKYVPVKCYPVYLKDFYFRKTGKQLDLENPQTFNEKIQWLKLYDSTPLKTKLADKYLVRDWVKEKIGDTPVLLLDDVLAELDDIRQNYLLNAIGEKTQTIITSVDTLHFDEEYLKDVEIFKISNGEIVA